MPRLEWQPRHQAWYIGQSGAMFAIGLVVSIRSLMYLTKVPCKISYLRCFDGAI
jgi:hypothetical protein